MFLLAGVMAGWTLAGCGQKRIDNTEVPRQVGAPEAAVAHKTDLSPSGHYLVESRDCLWSIAKKPKVYGDPFEWPALFKTNRDQIKDPDLIYPRQDLRVEMGLSAGEKDHVRQLAMGTPKYTPHSKPREALPLDYF
jgi:hypothetical protein